MQDDIETPAKRHDEFLILPVGVSPPDFSSRDVVNPVGPANLKRQVIPPFDKRKIPSLVEYFRKLTIFAIQSIKLYLFPIQIHFLVVFCILPRGHVIDPLLVIEIPSDCFFDAFFELEGRFPAEFVF